MKILNLPQIEEHKHIKKTKTVYTEAELKSMESFYKPKNITIKPKKKGLKNIRAKNDFNETENQISL